MYDVRPPLDKEATQLARESLKSEEIPTIS